MFSDKASKYLLQAILSALALGPALVYAESAKSPTGTASEGSTGKAASSMPSQSGSSGSESQMSGASGTAGSSDAAAGAKSASGKLSAADQRIVRELAHANLAEIAAGKLALSKSQKDEVKTFAQRMVDDHSQAQQELEQFAQSKAFQLPTAPDAKHQAMAKKMEALSGDQFDLRYMAQGGLADHRTTHRLLQRAQTRANDADLKQLAAKMLTVVDEHLGMAQQTHAALKSANSTSSGASGAGGAAAGAAK